LDDECSVSQVMRKMKKAHESFDIENAKIRKRCAVRSYASYFITYMDDC
jgi:hypothetical protein